MKTDLHDRVNLSEVDKNLNVMIDQVLTKQGIYKVLSIVGSSSDNLTLDLRTRKLNEFFIELSFQFHHSDLLPLDLWQMGKLFFTIQGLNNDTVITHKETTISVIIPVRKQISCLVIDDVASVRRLIERMLGSYGIQVFGADNYPDALNLIQFMKPDFILLDILMPKMDGWQMITTIKANPDIRDIPIITCSVLFEPELSKAVGAIGYIRKPINRLELINTLQELKLINTSIIKNA
jgi:CheY-like chemotaxis protein